MAIKFLVRCSASTPIRLSDEGLNIAFPDTGIALWAFRRRHMIGTHEGHSGIEYRIWVEADSAASATSSAIAAAENVNNLLSFAHSAGVQMEPDTWVIDLDDASTSRTLTQHFGNVPTLVPQSRPIDLGLLAAVSSAMASAAADQVRDAIIRRSLWHLRKSSLTDDLVEQFTELWLGLESVNPLISRQFDLKTTFVARSCKECGAPMEVAGGSAGITYAFVELAGASSETAKTARGLRRAIQHGLPSIYQELSVLPSIVPSTRDALVAALGTLLGLQIEVIQSLRRQAYTLRETLGEVTVTVVLDHLPVPELLANAMPPSISLGLVPRPNDPDGSEPRQSRHYGNLQIGVRHYNGTWSSPQIQWRGFEDPAPHVDA